MTYPFVADPDHFPRRFPIRAIAIHMAEGGGTVSHLQKTPGNSSHYVVERSGRVVQMVREKDAAASINPKLVRITDDRPFDYLGETITYGATAAKAALGDAWRDPNAAVIAIEVEGFAKDGPDDPQRPALRSLVADIRSRQGPLPALGHRDFQSYKACPGKRIPWADYGGHGPKDVTAPEEDVIDFSFTDAARSGTVTIVDDGTLYLDLSDGRLKPIGKVTKRAFGPVTLKGRGIGGIDDNRDTGYLIGVDAAFVWEGNTRFDLDTADAIAAGRESMRKDVEAAVAGIP